VGRDWNRTGDTRIFSSVDAEGIGPARPVSNTLIQAWHFGPARWVASDPTRHGAKLIQRDKKGGQRRVLTA
jgi:hypothetical protein